MASLEIACTVQSSHFLCNIGTADSVNSFERKEVTRFWPVHLLFACANSLQSVGMGANEVTISTYCIKIALWLAGKVQGRR